MRSNPLIFTQDLQEKWLKTDTPAADPPQFIFGRKYKVIHVIPQIFGRHFEIRMYK